MNSLKKRKQTFKTHRPSYSHHVNDVYLKEAAARIGSPCNAVIGPPKCKPWCGGGLDQQCFPYLKKPNKQQVIKPSNKINIINQQNCGLQPIKVSQQFSKPIYNKEVGHNRMFHALKRLEKQEDERIVIANDIIRKS